ncbi:MAG: hypothetical protein ACRC0X_00790 [Brevinema sp.]
MKKFLFFLLFITNNLWCDDIWFRFPANGQPVSGTLEIKIYPPPYDISIYVWIEDKRTDQLVWMSSVSSENDYTASVDTTRFRPGRYEINALYYMNGEDYEGDITIWVNSP